MSKFIDINVLQSVPASCINRDDANTPKSVIYGGSMRSRVSSQAWKRAVRMAFREQSSGEDWLTSHRTKFMPDVIAQEIMKQDSSISEEDALKKSLALFSAAKIGLTKSKDKKHDVTKALLMLSQAQIKNLAKYAIENDKFDAKVLKKIFTTDSSLDLALFGRMVADDTDLNADASCQVAHAFSVNTVQPEFDFFTAVDDDKSAFAEDAGSAMLDESGFNSSTLYRYANINFDELVNSLGDEKLAKKGVELFIKNFALSMPTGKQNSYANKTLPAYVMVSVREDTPVNLASAFEVPVKSRDGFVRKSIDKLEKAYNDAQMLVEKPVMTEVVTAEDSKLDKAETLNDLISDVVNTLD